MRIAFSVLISLIVLQASGQISYQKRIKAEGEYIHPATGVHFPDTFKQVFERIEITAYNSEKTDIGVRYVDKARNEFSVFVYPAVVAVSDRLTMAFFINSQLTSQMTKQKYVRPVKFSGEKYDCNGFEAKYLSATNERSYIQLFECGKWLFKIRLDTKLLDSAAVLQLTKEIQAFFNPSKLTELRPLSPELHTQISKAAFIDSLFLGATLSCAYKDFEWIKNNVSERELASGYPGYYLEAHKAAVLEFIRYGNETNFQKTEYAKAYIKQLELLIEAGFLEEFIWESNAKLLIIPNDKTFDLKAFKKWKRKNDFDIDYIGKYYTNYFMPA